MKIYIPNTNNFQKISSLRDVIKYVNFFDSIDPEISIFLTQWFDDTSEIFVQTSGSTGTPSTISISKKAMIKSAELTLHRFNLQPNDLIVNCLPTKFIAGKMMLIRAMVGHLNLHLVQPCSNPLVNFPECKIQFTALTPPQLEKGLENNVKSTSNIDTIIIGGAAISSTLQAKIFQLDSNCFATYGMTETITHIAIQSLNHPFEEHFKALDHIILKTKDDALVIKASHLKDSPIETKDIVELSADGLSFKWFGRKDFVINSGGLKLFPESIEKKLKIFIPHRFIIHKQVDSVYGEVPILIIESNVPLDLYFKTSSLDKFEIPKRNYYLAKFVETENGKINRIKTAELIKDIT